MAGDRSCRYDPYDYRMDMTGPKKKKLAKRSLKLYR